jgi:UDP-perosamine 4-acetyltransferase
MTSGPAARVILIGAGRFAADVTDVALDAGFEVAAWIEGLDEGRADPSAEPPVIWVGDLATFEPDTPVAPAISSPRRRLLVERLEADGRRLVSIVHPSAVIARSAVLAPGCVVGPHVVVGALARIGRGTILNRGALVGHHTTIGAHGFLGPGANVAGGVRVGDGVYVGLGAIVREDRTVGAGAMVGAGAVVVGDVEAGITVIGLPARPMERA